MQPSWLIHYMGMGQALCADSGLTFLDVKPDSLWVDTSLKAEFRSQLSLS